MSPRRVDREKKREDILRAAMRVFARQGVYEFKIIDIAKQAGIGKGTIYEYFERKEALINGCMELFMQDFVDYVGASGSETDDPRETIRQFITSTFDFFADDQSRLQMIFDLWSVTRGELRERPDSGQRLHYTEARDLVVSAIDRGIRSGLFRETEPTIAASVILASLDGVLFQAALGITNIHDRRFAAGMTDFLIRGLIA